MIRFSYLEECEYRLPPPPHPPRIYIYVITSGENRYNSRMAIAIGWKAA